MSFYYKQIIEVLAPLLISKSGNDDNCEYSRITNDSRNVAPGTVFVAIKGSNSDGHEFIQDAIEKGAKCIIHQKNFQNKSGTAFIKVSDSYTAYARIAELSCGFPTRALRMIGITGTNGKTTTAFLLKSILKEAGIKCGLISTVEYSFPGSQRNAERTTPDALELMEILCEIRNSGCQFVVMEVSSHALEQNRIGTTEFSAAVFTNLSGDHLDYHGDMSAYFNAKKRLFTQHLAEGGVAVINSNDEYGNELINGDYRVISYGEGEGDLQIKEYNSSLNGTSVKLEFKKMELDIISNLYGEYNVYNIAAAVGAALALDIDIKAIIRGIKSMTAVPGRLEGFKLPSGALALVDYAHTDDALANVLKTLRKLKENQLTVVFGCGGDRDKSKRSRMGAVAAKFADKVIITSDNPRSESPDAIIAEICTGIPENFTYEVFIQRELAIIQALRNAQKGDIVLIAGKGHEDYQEVKGVKYPFDDREIIRCYIG